MLMETSTLNAELLTRSRGLWPAITNATSARVHTATAALKIETARDSGTIYRRRDYNAIKSFNYEFTNKRRGSERAEKSLVSNGVNSSVNKMQMNPQCLPRVVYSKF
jgi:hypothetical protein